MGTSESTEGHWTATALVFSGRDDPQWTVPAEAIDRLLDMWVLLEPCDAHQPESVLGYRGVTLSAPDGRMWTAASGVVVLEHGADQDSRVDAERSWERTLLALAPQGTLPPLDF